MAKEKVTLARKLDCLRYCIEGEDSLEDAAGHLCDLLEYCRARIIDNDGKQFAYLQAMVRHYGKNPQTIEKE